VAGVSGPVEEYLRALEAGLRLRPERAAGILAEAEDHLRESVADGLAAGLTEAQAAHAAIASFGSVPDVVRAYQTQPRRAAALLTRRPGTQLLYSLYARRLRRQLAGCPPPRHVAIIMDGNRRWARQRGLADPSLGHKYGADHAEEVLGWCRRAGVRHVTVFACSAENLTGRDRAEVDYLMGVIEQIVADKLTVRPTWQVHIAGHLDMLPDSTARALKNAVEVSRDCATGAHLTLAVGYGGRQEVIDAFRSMLHEHAEAGTTLAELADTITMEDIARHLHTAGQPDPDLVIRTSGELRLSNFLLWQSAYSELYFCDTYWPAFREIDFLRALRSFAARQRRYGR
jgi:short-chain Z-isoprenyl diphosphate synthase